MANIQKGYEGEKQFDALFENSPDHWLILTDLLLDYNNSKFQIDTLVIATINIYLFDVKNFKGDFCIEGDKWKSTYGKEITNPVFQLQRCESSFRQLLQNNRIGSEFSVAAYLVFVNPEFTLYNALRDLPIVLPTQINRFLEKLRKYSPNQPLSSSQMMLAKQLVAMNIDQSPYARLPQYDFENLIKGIICEHCQVFMINSMKRSQLICPKCGKSEAVESCVLRSAEEFKLLFPEKKITTNNIYEWCKIITCKKRINRI